MTYVRCRKQLNALSDTKAIKELALVMTHVEESDDDDDDEGEEEEEEGLSL